VTLPANCKLVGIKIELFIEVSKSSQKLTGFFEKLSVCLVSMGCQKVRKLVNIVGSFV
jgi:hypothetical protein